MIYYLQILVCVLSSLCLAAGRPQTSSNYISPAASESTADFYLSPDFTLDQPPRDIDMQIEKKLYNCDHGQKKDGVRLVIEML